MIRYLPWARQFARACSAKLPSHGNQEDLQAAGVLGFVQAAGRYKETLGASFRGYCAVRIRGAVLDELRRWDWAPRSVYSWQKRIARVTLGLAERLDREPTVHEVASALGMEADALAELQAETRPRQLVSFDDLPPCAHADESLPLAERLADPAAAAPDARLRAIEDRRAMLRCIGELPKSQGVVIVLHYLEGVPLRDVARLLAVTPARISQLHHQALARLKPAWLTASGAA